MRGGEDTVLLENLMITLVCINVSPLLYCCNYLIVSPILYKNCYFV